MRKSITKNIKMKNIQVREDINGTIVHCGCSRTFQGQFGLKDLTGVKRWESLYRSQKVKLEKEYLRF